MRLRDRIRAHRLTPPAGPQYDLFELAFLGGAAALLIYTLPALTQLTALPPPGGPPPMVSAAEAWLTLPGQLVAGVCGIVGSLAVMGLSYRSMTMGHACWALVVMGVTWAITLTIGLIVSPYPWRPGSTFFLIASIFLSQYARKIWGHHLAERDWTVHCETRSHREGRV